MFVREFYTTFFNTVAFVPNMDTAYVLEATEEHMRELLSGEASGHDWYHTARVRKLARRIGAAEGADMFTVECAAMLHDISDWKLNGGDTAAGGRSAREFLERVGAPPQHVDHIASIISSMDYKGAGVEVIMPTLEGKVVFDADKLDAIGAIGIARTFAYGGAKGRPIYDPAIPPTMHATFEEYRSKQSHTINHFYEKLLLLKDRMQTPTGRTIALERHEYMQGFIDRFHAEWEGRE